MKTKSIILLAGILMLSAFDLSAGEVVASKKYVTTRVDIKQFENITIQGSPDVIFTQKKGKPSLEIYGSDNIVPLLETVVEGGTLYVRFKKNTSIRKTGTLEVRVTGEDLKNVKIIGSGDFVFTNALKTDEFGVEIRGSGDVRGKGLAVSKLSLSVQGSGDISFPDVHAGILDIKVNGSGDISLTGIQTDSASVLVNGSGDISLSGTGNTASYKVNGSGDIKAANFIVTDVKASIAGSGDISCHATGKLEGSVRGSGEVSYKGNPEVSFSGLRKL